MRRDTHSARISRFGTVKQPTQHLGISGKLPVLLVFGGSKGAHSINMAVLNNLQALLAKFEIIHFPAMETGRL